MKVGIITGASSGMGAETARQVGNQFKEIEELWLVARRQDKLLNLKQEIESKFNVNVRIFSIDLTNKEKREVLRERLQQENPEVILLVNCAGYGIIGPFSQGTVTEQTGMVDVNCEPLVWSTYVVLPYMKKGSYVIEYASGSAFLPQPYFTVYAATKAFVLHFSYGIRGELKNKGISVTAICPGPVKTDFFSVAQTHKQLSPIKKIFLADAKKVVEKALKDSKKRKSISTYGWSIKLLHFISHFMPKAFFAYIMGK